MQSNESLVNAYLEHMRAVRRRQPSTLHRYRNVYGTLLEFLDGKPLCLVTHQDLTAYLARERVHLRRGRTEVTPATIAHELAVCRSLFGWLHAYGHIASDPSRRVQGPRVINDDPKPADPDVWLKLWSGPLSDGDRVAFGLAYFCGLRRREVTSLRVHDFVDVPAPTVTVVRKGGRRQGLRWRSCLALCEQRLPHLLVDPELFLGPLFRLRQRPPQAPLLPWGGGPPPVNKKWEVPDGGLDPDLFNRHLYFALKRLGFPPRAFSPHQLRHGFGTNLCQAGVPIQVVSRLMGHRNVQITMRYVHVGVDPLADFLRPTEDVLEEVSPW